MPGPLDFLYLFRDLMREAGIRFAITSGMACVYYGLQQTTKDSDWIIAPDDLGKLRDLLHSKQRHVPPWRISYRNIFGAPLEAEWMAHGWTSHLLVQPTAGDIEEHLDFFGKPPRVAGSGLGCNELSFVPHETVALMKRTDRDKDWPIVDGLGRQMRDYGMPGFLEHIQHPPTLLAAWGEASEAERAAALRRRPLLAMLCDAPPVDVLDFWILAERRVWESVNQERHRAFTEAWKAFYRSWRHEPGWLWPTSEEFAIQHRRIVDAARRHSLPADPFPASARPAAYERGIQRAALRSNEPEDKVRTIAPPLEIMLP